MKKLLFLFLFIVPSYFLFTQEIVTIGTGSASSYQVPFDRTYNYTATEMIYPFTNIGFSANIDRIGFYKASGSITQIDSINIYMKHTSASNFTKGTTSLSGYTLVYSGAFPNSVAMGWVEIDLDTVFNYNNTNNLQMLIVKGNQTPDPAKPYYYGNLLLIPRYPKGSLFLPTCQVRRYYSSTTPWSSSVNLGLHGFRPHLRLRVQPTMPCSSSISGGNITPNTVYVEMGNTTQLHVENYSFLSGIDFEWQESDTENGTYSEVTSGTGNGTPYYTTPSVNENTFYRCNLTCTSSGVNDLSDTTMVISSVFMVTDTFNVCNNNFYDSGGVSSNYGNFESDTITFCASSNQHVKLNFLDFQTETNGLIGRNEIIYDYLSIYDGGDVYADEIFKFAGVASDTNKVPIVISTNECLTLAFQSNDSIPIAGWEAEVTCTDEVNQTATQFCDQALMMCEGETYYGSTSSFYNVEDVNLQLNSKNYPSELDNNSFYYFEASNDSATILLNVSNCSYTTCHFEPFPGRVEFSVYSGVNCTSLNLVSNSSYVTSGFNEGQDTIVLTNLNVGASYYVILDGWYCSTCDYDITIDSGIQCCDDTYISGDTLGIIGQTVQLMANAPSNWKTIWESSNTNVATINNSGLVTPNNPGVTTLTYNDNFGCHPTYTFYVEAAQLVVTDSIVDIDHLHDKGSIELSVAWGKPPYSYEWMPYNERLTQAEFSALYDSIPNFDSIGISIDTLYNHYLSQYTNNSLNGLGAGEYVCKITDDLGDTVIYTGFVNTNLILSNYEDFELENDVISNIDTLTNDTVSTIFGGLFIPEEYSKISFNIGQDSLCATFGLSYDAVEADNDTIYNDYFDIDYGLIFENNSTKIFYAGDTINVNSLVGLGDNVIIEADIDSIYFYVKDTLIFTDSIVNKSGCAPVLRSGSNGLLLSTLHYEHFQVAPRIGQTITNSICGLENTNSISMMRIGYNSVSYTWSGPGTFTSTSNRIPEVEAPLLEPGWYTVTCNTEYGVSPNIIGSSHVRNYFIGNHIIWGNTGLEHINTSGLQCPPTIVSGSAYSINRLSGDGGVYFEIGSIDDFGYRDVIVVGIEDEQNNKYEAIIFKYPGIQLSYNMSLLSASGTRLYIRRNYNVVHSEILNTNNIAISFEVDYVEEKILVSKKIGYSKAGVHTYYSAPMNEFNAIVRMGSDDTFLNRALSTFCFEQECPYHVLKRTQDGGYAKTVNGKLRFKYDEEYNTENGELLNYVFYDLTNGNSSFSISEISPIVSYGDNRYSIDIDTEFLDEHVYLLEVTNSKEEKRFLKFIKSDSQIDCDE